MKTCKLCGGNNTTTGRYCNSCYAYLRLHPEGLYEPSKPGEITYAPNGDAICHVCGMAVRKLGSHIAFKHHMTQKEYRDKFKLYHNTRLSNVEYINNMSKINKKYQNIVVQKNLIEKGKDTRISKGNGLAGRKFQYKINQLHMK